jgi:hypothetical protein
VVESKLPFGSYNQKLLIFGVMMLTNTEMFLQEIFKFMTTLLV